MSDPVIGSRLFTDGVTRDVYADGDREYVIGPDGQRVYGVWLVPAEEPAIVESAAPEGRA